MNLTKIIISQTNALSQDRNKSQIIFTVILCFRYESNKFYVMPLFRMKNDDKDLGKKWKQTSSTNLNKF